MHRLTPIVTSNDSLAALHTGVCPADTLPVGRVAIIGDVGGHCEELFASLATLGMDAETYILPPDLTVIQVGDLINRGPATSDVLRLVRSVMLVQPDHWIQLAGNHEGLYLPDAPRFPWRETLSQGGEDLLRHWWTSGAMTVSAGVATPFGDLLVTHAGLTAGLWSKLGQPRDVRETVCALNGLSETNPEWLWQTGSMFDGNPNWNAGPMWAEAGREVYASWLHAEAESTPVPFGQVHGHSSAYAWDKRQWRNPLLATRFLPVSRARHLHGIIGGKAFTGIDPDFGRSVHGPWLPLVLHGARVVAR